MIKPLPSGRRRGEAAGVAIREHAIAGVGKGVFALRAFRAGETLLEERPLVPPLSPRARRRRRRHYPARRYVHMDVRVHGRNAERRAQ